MAENPTNPFGKDKEQVTRLLDALSRTEATGAKDIVQETVKREVEMLRAWNSTLQKERDKALEHESKLLSEVAELHAKIAALYTQNAKRAESGTKRCVRLAKSIVDQNIIANPDEVHQRTLLDTPSSWSDFFAWTRRAYVPFNEVYSS